MAKNRLPNGAADDAGRTTIIILYAVNFVCQFLWASVLASWLIVPYFIWVSFAAVLNLFIVQLQWPVWHGTPGGGQRGNTDFIGLIGLVQVGNDGRAPTRRHNAN